MTSKSFTNRIATYWNTLTERISVDIESKLSETVDQSRSESFSEISTFTRSWNWRHDAISKVLIWLSFTQFFNVFSVYISLYNLKILCYNYLAFHWVGINLAHVETSVIFFYTFDMQIPCRVIKMGHWYSRVVSDYMVVDCLNGLCVCFNPTNLKQIRNIILYICELEM